MKFPKKIVGIPVLLIAVVGIVLAVLGAMGYLSPKRSSSSVSPIPGHSLDSATIEIIDVVKTLPPRCIPGLCSVTFAVTFKVIGATIPNSCSNGSTELQVVPTAGGPGDPGISMGPRDCDLVHNLDGSYTINTGPLHLNEARIHTGYIVCRLIRSSGRTGPDSNQYPYTINI